MPLSDRVVNLREFQVVRADGRRGRVVKLPDDVMRIDRMSRWGNPYPIGLHYEVSPGMWRNLTRSDSLDLYRQWLKRQLRIEPEYLRPLDGMRLACWCSPLPCHGDVIADLIA